MKISAKGKYALRFMFYLAKHSNDGFISLKDVSAEENISVKYLEQVTALLSKFGLLVSVRGPAGGYKLAKAPDQYSVAEIIHVTEGDFTSIQQSSDDSYSETDKIFESVIWSGLQKEINNYLNNITLVDLLNYEQNEANLMYMI